MSEEQINAGVEPIIKIENVRKTFDHGRVEALDGVSLNVFRKEVVVISGPSGSGKSTLLRCINRMEVPDSGAITVDGVPLTAAANINKVRMEVGMVFQQFNLFPHLTVLSNLMLAQRVVRKRSKAEAAVVAMDLLNKV
ncbi:MAG: amino acid ABC transporter ATP-binding protein, partial [Chloroflexi bacterium]|nr:amino acid ABC transporter ATP-binding protein [Chloroflexota bacterium]